MLHRSWLIKRIHVASIFASAADALVVEIDNIILFDFRLLRLTTCHPVPSELVRKILHQGLWSGTIMAPRVSSEEQPTKAEEGAEEWSTSESERRGATRRNGGDARGRIRV